jgi:ADP-heptose:LPS heptosyltransferase
MKPVCLNLEECNGLGDLICATPTIKKLSESYGQKITVLSQMPELFKMNPYVQKSFKASSVDMKYIQSNYIVHNSFYLVGKKDERGVEMKHNMMDIRQFHAIHLGFMLGQDELECYYRPTEEKINYIEGKYIVIHPVNSWPNRTWSQENWLKLSEELMKYGYKVVAVGKDSSETGFFNVNKPVHEMGNNIINLMNKTSISETWYLIGNSAGVVTMDSGILHLAGTTYADIIELGSPINPEFRRPRRKEGKHIYVRGACGLHCSSNMKYALEYWDTIDSVQPLIGCLEKKETFECHPSVAQVMHAINSNINII